MALWRSIGRILKKNNYQTCDLVQPKWGNLLSSDPDQMHKLTCVSTMDSLQILGEKAGGGVNGYHAVAVALNEDGLGMMQKPIKQR